jgi:hypothetical protein
MCGLNQNRDLQLVLTLSIVVLAFVVCGGLLLELLKVVPELWSTIAAMFSRITG